MSGTVLRHARPSVPSAIATGVLSLQPTAPRAGSSMPARRTSGGAETAERKLQQARLAREQTQRDQAALADRLRAENQRQEIQKRGAAGTNIPLPLDTTIVVNMGGEPVRVKVHDNDVTSFDVWINGAWRREVKKEKGITASGTDETFLDGNSRASLYYVWEIAGPLNHCLLRVRER